MGTADIPLLPSRRRVNRKTLDDLNRATWAHETFADAIYEGAAYEENICFFWIHKF